MKPAAAEAHRALVTTLRKHWLRAQPEGEKCDASTDNSRQGGLLHFLLLRRAASPIQDVGGNAEARAQ
jgi:hypothetical protein